jgi:hypothetical protein
MSPRSVRGGELVLGGEPRVDLLPPEVGLRVKARATRRMLGLLVVLALVVAAAGYVAGYFRLADEQAKLTAAEARTQELLAEQLQYADATAVADLVETTTTTRAVATSTEVSWAYVLGEIGLLPADAALYSFTVRAPAPWEAALLPAGPLREPRVATMTLEIRSNTVFDATAFARRLATIKGFADATPDIVARDESNGTYTTTITLNLGPESFSGRFVDDEAGVTE